MPKSGIFTIDWASIIDAALMAALGAVAAVVINLLGNGFDLFAANWVVIGKQMLNVAFAAGVLSVAKDFVSTTSGQVLGMGAPYQK